MLRNFLKPLLTLTLDSSFKTCIRNFTPRRAVLYVPAHDLRKVKKAFGLDVDCIMLDCEDGVALNKKPEARKNIRTVLDKGKPVKKRMYDLAVRVNSLSSEMLKDDLSVILAGKHLPDTIMLPKVEHPDDLRMFAGYLQEFIKGDRKLGLIMGIESANSLVNVVDLCKAAAEMSSTAKFVSKALLFGRDDFCASMGIRRTESTFEITYARQKIVTVAKAFNLQAIDMVYIEYKNLDGLKKQTEEGAQFGYTGKQIIHPGQVEIVQQAFMPTEKEIEFAAGVLESFHKHQKEGKGAFVYKGLMIDMPTMKQAQNIMDLVNAVMVLREK